MEPNTFALCLCCIDGRIHLPLIEWVKQDADVSYVDLITEPGLDGLLASVDPDMDRILGTIDLAVERHAVRQVYVSGHHDCLANPVDETEHRRQIESGVERLRNLRSDLEIIGVWVAEDSSVIRLS